MNKAMFWIGIVIIAVTAILMATVKEDINLGIMGILGVIFIAASEYTPMAKKKK
jgi:hypothetical protein